MSLKFIDIGANLTDNMFQGNYHGSQKHQPDLHIVLERAWNIGMQKIILTVGTLNEADEALKIAHTDDRIFITMGCHPTRCGDFESNPDEYFTNICNKIESNPKKIIAIGECGLDYDRLKFCDAAIQRKYFEKQLDLCEKYNLPLFLHCRNSHEDFLDIVKRNKSKIFPNAGGVVHSFDGNLDEAKRLIDFGFFIGVNGCSLKSEENLNIIKEIPIEKIMIETDCPWCGIRPSHASAKFVKTQFPTVKKKEKWTKDTLIDGRNEPCQIIQVLEVIAGIKSEPIEKLAEIFYNNANKLFFKK